MSSFFSPKLKSQARQNPSSGAKMVGGEYSSFGNKSTFSKMRKKRPPPINISLERGNVILTGGTPTSSVIYTDTPWSPSSPRTPHSVACTNPRCMARDTLLMSPPLASQFNPTHSCQSSTAVPNLPYSSQNCFHAAELPGSDSAPLSVELDVPSTPTRFSFDHPEGQLLDSPPDLIPSSGPDAGPERGSSFSFDHLQPREPSRNGKTLAQMTYEELMEILPELSPNQVKVYWHPAICQELYRVKQKRKDRSSVRSEAQVHIMEGQQESYTSKDLERVRSDCEVRLNMKENEISGLLRLHDSRITSLCDFISTRLGPQLNESNDPSLQTVKEILSDQQQRIREPLASDKIHMMQCRQIEEQQNHIGNLESAAGRNEKRLKTYKRDAKALKQENKSLNEDKQRHHQELTEKDAHIAVLNNKVVQLLTMNPAPFPPSVTQGTNKDLPSPAPCDWKRVDELKQQMSFRHSAAIDVPLNFPESVDPLGVGDGQGSLAPFQN